MVKIIKSMHLASVHVGEGRTLDIPNCGCTKMPSISVNWPAQKPADYARNGSTLFTLRLMTQIDTTGTIVNRLALRAHAIAYT